MDLVRTDHRAILLDPLPCGIGYYATVLEPLGKKGLGELPPQAGLELLHSVLILVRMAVTLL
jgi:hypothetical protein